MHLLCLLYHRFDPADVVHVGKYRSREVTDVVRHSAYNSLGYKSTPRHRNLFGSPVYPNHLSTQPTRHSGTMSDYHDLSVSTYGLYLPQVGNCEPEDEADMELARAIYTA